MFVELMAITSVLSQWKKNPSITKREIGVWHHWEGEDPEYDKPLTENEVERMKKFLRDHSPTTYYKMFPKEQ